MATLYVMQDRNGSEGRNNENVTDGHTEGNVGGTPAVGKNGSNSSSVTPNQSSVSNSTFTTTLEPHRSMASSSASSDVVLPTEPSRTHNKNGKKKSVTTDNVTSLQPTTVVQGKFFRILTVFLLRPYGTISLKLI